jgi:tRNA G37 N-methylase TrmD
MDWTIGRFVLSDGKICTTVTLEAVPTSCNGII